MPGNVALTDNKAVRSNKRREDQTEDCKRRMFDNPAAGVRVRYVRRYSPRFRIVLLSPSVKKIPTNPQRSRLHGFITRNGCDDRVRNTTVTCAIGQACTVVSSKSCRGCGPSCRRWQDQSRGRISHGAASGTGQDQSRGSISHGAASGRVADVAGVRTDQFSPASHLPVAEDDSPKMTQRR